MASVRILHDGWPLAHAPLSAAAWQLRTLLALAPADAELLLAAPAGVDRAELPERVELIEAPVKDRGTWEQKTLPDLATKHSASFIHTTALGASLLGKATTLVSPAELASEGERGRLAAAQARGGLARAQILWPSDTGQADLPGNIHHLPPVVHPAFLQPALRPALDLPEEYLLYQGTGGHAVLLRLLESWTWAAASIGDLYPLMLAGLKPASKTFIEAKLPDFHLEDYVRVVDAQPGDLPGLVQHCAAFIHPEEPAPWGSSLRHALACGKAVVAHQDPLSEAIVGSAGYLVDANDLRSFGAATITVVVDEKVRESLEAQAKQKSARWSAGAFSSKLAELYTSLA